MSKVVKSKYPQMGGYSKWTEVSDFLACGLVGVQDITLYRKPTIDEWIQSGYMIPKNGIYKKLIDKHSFNN
tara:strand:+ start:494 stop:706 length:213 start_codon:yes stop_codon:yes gene_type:complete